MRRLSVAVLVLLAGSVVGGLAQNPAPENPPKLAVTTITLQSFGSPASEVIENFAGQLGFRVVFHPSFERETPCWLRLDKMDVDLARKAVGYGAGAGIVVNNKEGIVTAYGPEAGITQGKARVYNVSALCGRYVQYVNKYAPARRPLQLETSDPKAAPQRAKTAADHLLDVMCDVIFGENASPGWSAVGDRLLMRLDDTADATVREFLNILLADVPGESATIAAEKAMNEKLTKVFKIEAEERPAASVIMELAQKAGVNVVILNSVAERLADAHVTPNFPDTLGAYGVIQALVQDHDGVVIYRHGCLTIGSADFIAAPYMHYHVFELSGLLAKLDKAYELQRTASGREGGFEGSLREQGGVDVVANALQLHFEHEEQRVHFFSYGSRMIALGGLGTRELVMDVLKGLGWDEP